jgi:hypothetical protein
VGWRIEDVHFKVATETALEIGVKNVVS